MALLRTVEVGLLAAGATIAAILAGFTGPLDAARVTLIVVAGLFALGAVVPFKKSSQSKGRLEWRIPAEKSM